MPSLKSASGSQSSSRDSRRKGPSSSRPKSASRRVRGPYHKACAPCAKAKRQCDGDRPCARCVQRNHAHLCIDSVDKRSKSSKPNSSESSARSSTHKVAAPPKQRSSDLSLELADPVAGYPRPPPGGGVWGQVGGLAGAGPQRPRPLVMPSGGTPGGMPQYRGNSPGSGIAGGLVRRGHSGGSPLGRGASAEASTTAGGHVRGGFGASGTGAGMAAFASGQSREMVTGYGR